jgi:hypothetical protein
VRFATFSVGDGTADPTTGYTPSEHERIEAIARDQVIAGLGGHAFIARRCQDAYRIYRPYFEGSPIYGSSNSLDQYAHDTR